MILTIHIHHHGEPNDARLAEILTGIDALKAQMGKLMGLIEDLRKDISDINVATDTIAAEVQALREQLADDLTPENVTEVRAALGGIVTRLNSIGKPETPAGNVPPTAPTPDA